MPPSSTPPLVERQRRKTLKIILDPSIAIRAPHISANPGSQPADSDLETLR